MSTTPDSQGTSLQGPECLASRLLDDSGKPPLETLTFLAGGRNNSVHLIETSDEKFVLKQLFHSAHDQRDRFRAESQFYSYCANASIHGVPNLVAASTPDRALLLEFIEGERVVSEDVGETLIDSAIDFVTALNQAASATIDLSPASECCFTIAEHLTLIDARITKLENQLTDSTALDFVHANLRPSWEDYRERTDKYGRDFLTAKTSPCVSPSDFGFHNCILGMNRGAVFFDFEYAGWDDPAKLVSDFFCQVQVPVPDAYLPGFIERLSELFDGETELERRVQILLPAYKLKWCCISLNEFLPRDSERRQFAGRDDSDAVRVNQLSVARKVLNDARQLTDTI